MTYPNQQNKNTSIWAALRQPGSHWVTRQVLHLAGRPLHREKPLCPCGCKKRR